MKLEIDLTACQLITALLLEAHGRRNKEYSENFPHLYKICQLGRGEHSFFQALLPQVQFPAFPKKISEEKLLMLLKLINGAC